MESYLIVGLGNPGKEYAWTRHNVGFLVLDQLAFENKIEFTASRKYGSFIGQGTIGGKKVVLLKPQSYMNRSGIAVKSVIDEKLIFLKHVLVVCDDFNLDFGSIRLRPRGSDGGHNGLGSIIERIETRDFSRLRIGIGKPPFKNEISYFVLSKFTSHERKEIDIIIDQAVRCCQAFLEMKISAAMNLFNKKNIKGEKKEKV